MNRTHLDLNMNQPNPIKINPKTIEKFKFILKFFDFSFIFIVLN